MVLMTIIVIAQQNSWARTVIVLMIHVSRTEDNAKMVASVNTKLLHPDLHPYLRMAYLLIFTVTVQLGLVDFSAKSISMIVMELNVPKVQHVLIESGRMNAKIQLILLIVLQIPARTMGNV